MRVVISLKERAGVTRLINRTGNDLAGLRQIQISRVGCATAFDIFPGHSTIQRDLQLVTIGKRLAECDFNLTRISLALAGRDDEIAVGIIIE